MTPQEQVDVFNSKHGVGQRVMVTKDDGTKTTTFTRSKAQVLSNHTAVIWLEGIVGCYALERVTPIAPNFPPLKTKAPDKYVSRR
jgi:hypothetical protein